MGYPKFKYRREKSTRWKNGRTCVNGYAVVFAPGHPRAHLKNPSRGSGSAAYVYEHILIAERVLGHSLPGHAQVHHVNGKDNSGSMIICQDQAYHSLLHQRTRALKACGHVNWFKCRWCKQYNAPETMGVEKSGRHYHLGDSCGAAKIYNRAHPPRRVIDG